jgi:uncharacterized membrane protein
VLPTVVKRNLKGLLGLVALFYPLVVFLSVVVFDVKPNHLSLFICLFGIAYFVIVVTNPEQKKLAMFISPLLLILIGIAGYCLDMPFVQRLVPGAAGKTNYIIKLYPVFANTAYFILFFTTMLFPPTLVFDIAVLFDKRTNSAEARKPMEAFSMRASVVWCIFFVIDGVIAVFTVFLRFGDPKLETFIWGIYNGLITYILMATIAVVQFFRGKIIIKTALKDAGHHTR